MVIIILIFLVLITIQIYRRLFSNAKIILIEGLDCSGKKTLAKQIAQHFKDINLIVNIGPLFKSPISKLSDRFTYNWKLPNFMRSFLYALSYIADGLLFIPKRNVLILQISYLPRHKGYNTIMKLRLLNFIHFLLAPFYIRFNKIIYLYADYDIRIDRHLYQFKGIKEIQNIEDRFFMKNKSLYIEWEKQVKKNLKQLSREIMICDTSNISREEILNKLILQGFKI